MFKQWWIKQDAASDGASGGDGGGADTVISATDTGGAQTTDTGDKGGAKAETTTTIDKPAAKEETKQIWPDDWRKQVAGEDEKELKRLGRFASPADLYKMNRELEKRLSSGEMKQVLPKDAKPEELAQWRKDNGIPESADKYDVKLEGNFVIGDSDKPFIDEFLKSAHAKNMTPEQVNSSVQWYFQNQAKQAEARSAKDETDRVAALDALNAEWGSSFRQNVNMVGGLLGHFPASVQEAMKNARLPDGTALFNNPDVVRGFTAMALEINPAGTIVPPGGGDPVKGIDDRIGEIEKVMTENRKAYNKDEKMQAEYRELLTAKEKIKARK